MFSSKPPSAGENMEWEKKKEGSENTNQFNETPKERK